MGKKALTRPRTCVYCGASATTRDHVPPKCILRKPFPELITVPACHDCNSALGPVDEQFRNTLSLMLGLDTPAKQEFWDQRVARGVGRGGRATRIVRPSPFGIVVNTDALEPMLRRLVYGLCYATLKIRMPPSVPLEAGFLLEGVEALAIPLYEGPGFRHRRVGPDFEYRYGFVVDPPFSSFWLFSFFGALHAMCLSGGAVDSSVPMKRIRVLLSDGALWKYP